MKKTISETKLVDGRLGLLYPADETKVEVFADGIRTVSVANSCVKIIFYSLVDINEEAEKRDLVAKIVLPVEVFKNSLNILGQVKEQLLNANSKEADTPPVIHERIEPKKK